VIYRFNNIEINTESFTLSSKEEEIAVEPQVFNVIIYLIENRDRIVSRDDLLDNIWKDRIVSDTSINNHIKSVRKVLGDDGIKQAVIKTIHSRGYQFIAKIEDNSKAIELIEQSYKPKKFRSNMLVLSAFVLLVFVSIKYYQKKELSQAIQNIANYQEISYATFIAQAKRRNELVDMIENRAGEKREMQFEKFFSYYFKKLNNEEKFVFDQIRAMTDIGLYQNNQKILNELNSHPKIFQEIKATKELQQHLSFWINKYHSVFKQREDMCLLYVGVEDDVPYPFEVNNNVKNWLHSKKSIIVGKSTATPDKVSNEAEIFQIEKNQLTQLKTIAVLPFSNTRPDVDTDFLGFALAYQIIGDLTNLDKFTIRPAGSIRKYVDQIIDPLLVGKELQAQYVLNGNYLKEDSVIRLNVELIEVASNKLVWRESMQVNYSNTFSLQDMVAQKVAKGLNVGFRQNSLTDKFKDIPNNALAYEYYLRGISYPFSNQGHKMAVEMLGKSIELDPNYAPAYAHLGNHRRLLEQHGRIVPQRMQNAEWYYKKALEINPQLLEALNNLSAYYTETNRIEEALITTRKMLAINPDSANAHFSLGYIYRYAGMLDQSIQAMEIALKISPNNSRFRSIVATYVSAGKYKEALSKVYLDKGDYGIGYSGIIAFNQENNELAIKQFNKVLAIDADGIWGLIAQVYLAVIHDNKPAGLAALTKMVETNIVDAENYYYFSDFYAMLEEEQSCLDMLERAVNTGYFNYPHISQNHSFDFIHTNPRFIATLKKAKQRHDSFRDKFL